MQAFWAHAPDYSLRKFNPSQYICNNNVSGKDISLVFKYNSILTKITATNMLGKEQPACGVERVLDCTHMFSDHEISESFLLMFHK